MLNIEVQTDRIGYTKKLLIERVEYVKCSTTPRRYLDNDDDDDDDDDRKVSSTPW